MTTIKLEPICSPISYWEGDLVLAVCGKGPAWPARIISFRGYDEEEVEVYKIGFLGDQTWAYLEKYHLSTLTIDKIGKGMQMQDRVLESQRAKKQRFRLKRAYKIARQQYHKLQERCKHDYKFQVHFRKVYLNMMPPTIVPIDLSSDKMQQQESQTAVSRFKHNREQDHGNGNEQSIMNMDRYPKYTSAQKKVRNKLINPISIWFEICMNEDILMIRWSANGVYSEYTQKVHYQQSIEEMPNSVYVKTQPTTNQCCSNNRGIKDTINISEVTNHIRYFIDFLKKCMENGKELAKSVYPPRPTKQQQWQCTDFTHKSTPEQEQHFLIIKQCIEQYLQDQQVFSQDILSVGGQYMSVLIQSGFIPNLISQVRSYALKDDNDIVNIIMHLAHITKEYICKYKSTAIPMNSIVQYENLMRELIDTCDKQGIQILS